MNDYDDLDSLGLLPKKLEKSLEEQNLIKVYLANPEKFDIEEQTSDIKFSFTKKKIFLIPLVSILIALAYSSYVNNIIRLFLKNTLYIEVLKLAVVVLLIVSLYYIA